MFSFYELSFIKIEKFAIEEQEKGSKSLDSVNIKWLQHI